jgi:O-antigen/teichoic acid export membrane protein
LSDPVQTIAADTSVGEARTTLRHAVSWGFVDQGLSSMTNFGLAVLGGRLLGPKALGVVSIGFASYILALILHRSLVTEPLVVASSRADAEDRATITRSGVTATLVASVLAFAAMAVPGLFLAGGLGRGLLLFAPWMMVALLQDFWRSILFRDHRARGAVANDAAWLVGMVISLPLVLIWRTDCAVVACWGFGAGLGAVLGFFQLRFGIERLRPAWLWWKRQAWPFGRWLSLDRIVGSAENQGLFFLVAVILGTAAVGGLKAAQSLFAPLTLIGPAIGLPALPALARTVAASPSQARRMALRLSALVSLIGVAYMAIMIGFGRTVLSVFFGRAFAQFQNLVIPVSAGQIVAGAGAGYRQLLKAAKNSGGLVWSDLLGTITTLTMAWLFAARFGLTGAIWGNVLGAAVATILMIVFAYRIGRAPGSGSQI